MWRSKLQVQIATKEDIPSWLVLSSEVEYLFGPMVDNRLFHDSLIKCITQRLAFCVRERNGEPGSPLMGALMLSAEPPVYRIGWLAVAQKWRRQGVGRLLMEFVFNHIKPPAEVIVTTFDENDKLGQEAVMFYKNMGFKKSGRASVRAPSGIECIEMKRIFRPPQ
jgi:ribosomal protein S18 acetylase RimI-like enzyme